MAESQIKPINLIKASDTQPSSKPLIWLDTSYNDGIVIPQVNDTMSNSTVDTWSSSKINSTIDTKVHKVNDTDTAATLENIHRSGGIVFLLYQYNRYMFYKRENTTAYFYRVDELGLSRIITRTDDLIYDVSELSYPAPPIGTVQCLNSYDSSILTTMYPGTSWTAIDREFSSKYYNSTTSGDVFTWNTTNVTSVSMASFLRSGHDVFIYLNLVPKVALTDTAVELGTLNLEAIGVTQFPTTQHFPYFNDGGNVIIDYALTAAGVLSVQDVMIRGSSTASLNAGTGIIFQGNKVCLTAQMRATACNKFWFKRTA